MKYIVRRITEDEFNKISFELHKKISIIVLYHLRVMRLSHISAVLELAIKGYT